MKRPMGASGEGPDMDFPRPMGVEPPMPSGSGEPPLLGTFTPGHTNVPGSPYPASMACGCGAEFHTLNGHTSKGQLERHQLWCRGVPFNPLHVLDTILTKVWIWCHQCEEATEHFHDGTFPGDVMCRRCHLVQFTLHAVAHEKCRPECTTVQERGKA